MIDYDFIEIGTCDFDTLAHQCSDSAVGICVEPIPYYLDRVPARPHVTKVNCAISFDNSENNIDIYYIPAAVLKAQGLPEGLAGCNRIGQYHPHHESWGLTHLVEIMSVPQMSLETFLTRYQVRGIGHLKLDTEGGDCFILNNLIAYLNSRGPEFRPRKITFETNLLTKQFLIEATVARFENMGYRIQSRNNWHDDGNTVLIYQ